MAAQAMKTCKYCASEIKKAAKVCPYCRKSITANEATFVKYFLFVLAVGCLFGAATIAEGPLFFLFFVIFFAGSLLIQPN